MNLDELLNNFKDYTKKNKVKGIKVNYNGSQEIRIIARLINYKITVDILLTLAVLFGLSLSNFDEISFYLIPICMILGLIAFLLWTDFDFINIIQIDLANRNIKIISRNLFKRFFQQIILSKRSSFSLDEI